MKRTLALLLVFLSFLPSAIAETSHRSLAELRAQAAQGWHQTYTAHGRTIAVDIPIQVPDADALPVLTAEVLPIRSGIPDTSRMSDGFETQDHSYFNEIGSFRVDTPGQSVLRAFLRQRKDADCPRGMEMQPRIVRLNELDEDTAYTYNLSATLRDAQAQMQEVLDTYFAEEQITLQPHWIHARAGIRMYDRTTGTFSGDPWAGSRAPLIVYFDQVLNGVPIIASAAEALGRYAAIKTEKGASTHLGGIAILQDEGMDALYTSLQLNNLLKAKNVLSAAPSLCDLSAVRASCEQLIKDGRLRRVDSLRLGYAAFYKTGGEYTLSPVWVAEGELFERASAEYRVRVTEALDMPAEYGMILFDAQTGAFIDPWTAGKNAAYQAPDILK